MRLAGLPEARSPVHLLQELLGSVGNSQVEHRRHPGLRHCFHLQAGFLQEADDALRHLGSNLRSLVDRGRFAT